MSASVTKFQFSQPIIASFRRNVIDLFKQELKSGGVLNAKTATNISEYKTLITDFPDSLLIVDWAMGQDVCIKLLSAARQLNQHRSIVLILSQIDEAAIATASEYGVAQIMTYEIKANFIQEWLVKVNQLYTSNSTLNDSFIKIYEHKKSKDFFKAQRIVENLLENSPENPRIKCELVEVYIAQNLWKQALKVAESMKKLDPPYLRALHLYGRCLLKFGRYEASREELSRANLLNPYNVERLNDLGQALLNLNQSKEAKDTFNQALKIDPTNKDAILGKSTSMLLEGEINEALELISQVGEKKELASVFNTAAIIAIRSQKFNEGFNLYKSAMKAVDEDSALLARLWFNMGMGYERSGDEEKSKECYDKAMTLDPSYERARQKSLVAPAQTPEMPSPSFEKSSDGFGFREFDETQEEEDLSLGLDDEDSDEMPFKVA